MSLAGLLADVLPRLDDIGIPYMVTGSLASSYHGEPRATLDLDVVIDPTEAALERLVDGLQDAGYYVDRDAAHAALRTRGQFNAIGPDSSKVDFILRRNRPLSVEEFARRQAADLLGTPGTIASAEDLVIAKLEWAVASESERQLRDVAGILAAAGEEFDEDYVERWVDALGLAETWRDVRGRSA
jgi:hypothetical protein